jgi:hypothetical protein
VSAGEGDPFWSPNLSGKINQEMVISKLVELLVKSEQHWNEKIVGFLSIREMEESGFVMSSLDLNKLGYICVEDLVCFVNLHTKNLYRNRDLLTIFKRVCQANGLDHQSNQIQYEKMERVLIRRSLPIQLITE